MPTIAGTTLTTGSSLTDTTSYTTASISPTANRLYIASVFTVDNSGGPDIPTLTGNGLTWEVIRSDNRSQLRQTIFRASSTTTPTAGTLAIACASAQDRASWGIIEFENADLGSNGADAIVQTAYNAGNPVTSLTVTLAAFGHTDNATYGSVFMLANDSNVVSVGSGFTQINNFTGESNSHQSQWKNSNDTSVDWAWNAGASVGGIGMEIQAKQISGSAGMFLSM